jgi:MFS family permease
MSTTFIDTDERYRGLITPEERKVLIASSLGTIFEWYDFILFGSLAGIVAQQFFTKLDPATGFVFALLSFSAGFIVRPLGAVVFGGLGDRIGRKYTFLATILVMGASTFLVGVLPSYDTIGLAAPVILITLRLLQGLAVGGEYGGAVVYVAENAPPERRGFFTSWIQTTATGGFILSLIAVLITRLSVGEAAFAAWGWRIPFLISIILLGASVWIRMSLHESPVFARMRAEGKVSKAPLSEAFGHWSNVKIVLAALFGLVAGFGVVWYTAQFYVLLFLTQTLKIDGVTANIIMIVVLTMALPFFVFFGTISDRVGRKWIVLSGIMLAALAFFPVFKGLTHFGNPALERALANAPVVVSADPQECQFQFNLTGTSKFTTSCDIAKSRLVALSVNYANEPAAAGAPAVVRVGSVEIPSVDAKGKTPAEIDAATKAFSAQLTAAIQKAGYPAKADPAEVNRPMVVLLAFILVFFLAMAYGPVASMLVELFPARIRYSSLSVPYHIGTGWFGGLAPTIGFALVAWKGDIYYGLWFPVIVAAVTAVLGVFLIKETKDVDISK